MLKAFIVFVFGTFMCTYANEENRNCDPINNIPNKNHPINTRHLPQEHNHGDFGDLGPFGHNFQPLKTIPPGYPHLPNYHDFNLYPNEQQQNHHQFPGEIKPHHPHPPPPPHHHPPPPPHHHPPPPPHHHHPLPPPHHHPPPPQGPYFDPHKHGPSCGHGHHFNNQGHNSGPGFPFDQQQPFGPNFNPNVNPNVNPKVNPNVNANGNPNVNPNVKPNVNPNVNPSTNPNVGTNFENFGPKNEIPITSSTMGTIFTPNAPTTVKPENSQTAEPDENIGIDIRVGDR